MQAHPNLTIVAKFFDAYNKGDEKRIKETLSDNVEWSIPGSHSLSGTKRGSREVIAYLREIGKFGFQAQQLVVGVNEKFVVDCHLNWTVGDGPNAEFMSCLLWQIDDGKIIKVYNFPQNQTTVDDFFNRNQV